MWSMLRSLASLRHCINLLRTSCHRHLLQLVLCQRTHIRCGRQSVGHNWHFTHSMEIRGCYLWPGPTQSRFTLVNVQDTKMTLLQAPSLPRAYPKKISEPTFASSSAGRLLSI